MESKRECHVILCVHLHRTAGWVGTENEHGFRKGTLSWLCHTNWPCHGMVIMKQDMDDPTVEYGSPHGKNDQDNTPRWE